MSADEPPPAPGPRRAAPGPPARAQLSDERRKDRAQIQQLHEQRPHSASRRACVHERHVRERARARARARPRPRRVPRARVRVPLRARAAAESGEAVDSERLTEELATLRALCAASAEENARLRTDAEQHAAHAAAMRAELAALHDLEGTHMTHPPRAQSGDEAGTAAGTAAPAKKSLFAGAKINFKFGHTSAGAAAAAAPQVGKAVQ